MGPKATHGISWSRRSTVSLLAGTGRGAAAAIAAAALLVTLLPGSAEASGAIPSPSAAGRAAVGQRQAAAAAFVGTTKAKPISKTVTVGRSAAKIRLRGATLVIRRGTFTAGTRVTLTLGARPPRSPYGVRRYTTSISVRASGGQQPRKPVHLLLPYKATLPAGLTRSKAIRPATYNARTKKWTLVPFTLASRGRVDITLKHFSWKDLFTFDWNGLYDSFKKAAGLKHINPHCSAGSRAPAWLNVDATPYGIDSCVRSEGNRAYIEFANNHPYGVIINFGGINPRATPWTDWGDNDANTRAILSRIAPYLFGDSELYVGPWGVASLGFNPGTWNYTSLSVRPTGTTWAIDALRLLLPYTPGLRDVAGKADSARELANSLWTCTKPVSDGIKNGNPASIATGFQCLARKFAESKIDQFEKWLLRSVAALIGLANAIGTSISLIANTLAGQASTSIGLTNKTPTGGTAPPPAPPGSSTGWHVVGAGGGLGFHTQPNSSSPTTRVLPNGAAVAIVCQIAGASVTFAGRPSIVWNKTAQGDYATDVYFDTPVAWNFSPQFPRCEDYTPPTTPPTPSTGGAASITVNTCNTYGNCTTFNPIYVHSSPTVSSRIADAPNGLALTAEVLDQRARPDRWLQLDQ
ncbi:MAG: hypothetical protein U0S36_02520 [Candidatus Nanopelagicales bacterium]